MTKPAFNSGYIYIVMSTVGYAFFPIFTKFIYAAQDFHPFDVTLLRFFTAIPIMWLFVVLWQRFGSPVQLENPLPRFQLMLTGVLLCGAGITAFFGLQFVDAGLFVVLFFSYPAMTAILSAMLGEHLPRRAWFAIGLTLTGVVLTTPNIFTLSLTGDMLLGVLIALLNALVVAVFMVWSGRIQRGYPSTIMSSAWSLTGTLFVIVPLLLWRGVQLPDAASTWGLLLGMSSFSTVLPIFGLIMGLRALGASRASILGTLEPVLLLVLAYVLLGERMLPIQLVGAALIITSILVLEVRIGARKPITPAALSQ